MQKKCVCVHKLKYTLEDFPISEIILSKNCQYSWMLKNMQFTFVSNMNIDQQEKV